jgi:CRP-like cAMP-binding protein
MHSNLHEPGEKLEVVHFPNRGLVSLVVNMREGKTVEVGAVGREGLVGMPGLVGFEDSPFRAVVQLEGDGFSIRLDHLREILPSTPSLHKISSRYAVIQGMYAAQSAGCNRLHGIEQRLARWLLTMQDRIGTDSLQITHDFLATMLGTDRPSVSLAAGNLQKKGAIEYSRGLVTIANRQLLEGNSCECYGVLQQFSTALI